MGYSTDFTGELKFEEALTPDQISEVEQFLGEDCRDHPEWNAKNMTYIDLQFTRDYEGLSWDGSEKTYELPEKVNLIISHMREKYPSFGLTGSLLAQGESVGDIWRLVINKDGFAERREIELDLEVEELEETAAIRRVGVFAGSFNPFTVGHMNVFEQAEAVFGKGNVIVALGQNSDKAEQSFSRIPTLQNQYPEIPFTSYEGFLHEFVEKLEETGANVTLIRGLRSGHDLQYEMNQAAFIKDFNPNMQIAYFLCDPQYAHVSSSAVRAVEKLDPELAKKYIP